MGQIIGSTKLLGVIGDPIAHSLSPVMHNAALVAMGLDRLYLPLEVKPEGLAAAMAGFAAIGLEGFSVTIPHKQAVIPLLAEVSQIARTIGAVNTVHWTGTGWYGTNTDLTGFVAPLKELRPNWSDCIAVILGNGGAARAVVAGCAQLGFAQVQVVGRNPEKRSAFEQHWRSCPPSVYVPKTFQVEDWAALSHLLPQADLVVNTTPVGMAPHGNTSPLTIAQTEQLKASAIVYDLIYTPCPTQLLQQAIDRGCQAIDGLEMLVQQGAAALELWTQQSAPVGIMRRSLQDHLGH